MEIQNKDMEVFRAIENLMTDVDFYVIQYKFFKEHHEKFENTEENKHEYNDIFQLYMKILDENIDLELSK